MWKKAQITGPPTSIGSDSVGLRWDLRIYIPNKLPREADVAVTEDNNLKTTALGHCVFLSYYLQLAQE